MHFLNSILLSSKGSTVGSLMFISGSIVQEETIEGFFLSAMILILGTPDKGIKSGPFSKTFFLSHVAEG